MGLGDIGVINTQGVVLALCRLDPESPQAKRELCDGLLRALEEPPNQLLSVECLGRYDLFLAVRCSSSKFYRTELLPPIAGVKKIDIQYLYGCADEVGRFWETAMPAVPLLSAVYVRLRDDVSLRAGQASHDGAWDALGRCVKQAKESDISALRLRATGWPDFAVLAAGSDLATLGTFVRDRVWSLKMADLGEAACQLAHGRGPRWPQFSEDGGDQAALSRTCTVLGVRTADMEQCMLGSVKDFHVLVRVRPGSDVAVARLIRDEAAAQDWAGPAESFLQIGSSDMIFRFPKATEVPADRLIRWYFSSVLPSISHLATTTELCLGIPVSQDAIGQLRSVILAPPLALPQRFLSEVEGNGMAASVAACVRNMVRMINWAVTNDALYSLFMDLYLHTRRLCEYLNETAKQRPDQLPELLDQAGLVSRIFSEAFAQRLCGTYYDLTSDKPEPLIEHMAGQQKALTVLWGLQHALIASFSGQTNVETMPAYWVATREGDPAECDMVGPTIVFRICSSLLSSLGQSGFLVGHEVGHAIHRAFVGASAVLHLKEISDHPVLLDLFDRLHKLERVPDGEHEEYSRSLLLSFLPRQLQQLSDTDWLSRPRWRACTASLLRETFADAFALFMFPNPASHVAIMAGIVLRTAPSRTVRLKELCVRIWLTHRISSVIEASESMSIERVLNDHNVALAIPAFTNETDREEFVDNTWNDAMQRYREWSIAPRLAKAWEQAKADLGWMTAPMMDCCQASVTGAFYCARTCLGVGVETSRPETRTAMHMYRMFRAMQDIVPEGLEGLPPPQMFESMWNESMGLASIEVESLFQSQ